MLIKYEETLKEKLAQFNKRLYKNKKEKFVTQDSFKYYTNKTIYKSELWVLIKNSEIVASVTIKTQNYYVSGVKMSVNLIKLPISLAIVDKRYLWAPIALIQNIKVQFPYSYLLGMGGSQATVANFFSKFDFKVKDIPFYIKHLNYFNILTQNPIILKYLKIVSKIKFNYPLIFTSYEDSAYKVEQVFDFDKEDLVDRKSNSTFELVRESIQLNAIAPKEISNFLKYRFIENSIFVGTSVIFVSKNNNHKYFGNLKIAVILDLYLLDKCKYKNKVIDSLVKKLKKNNIDIILFNCGDQNILPLIKKNKWTKYKTQWAIAASPELSKRIDLNNMYLTRLDGDGPINLGYNL